MNGISDSVVPKEIADIAKKSCEDAVRQVRKSFLLDLDDEIIELSITPNRADALSMCGVAHEMAATSDKAVNFKEFTLTETNEKLRDMPFLSALRQTRRLTMNRISRTM